MDISGTIAPKSDQLNAEDLLVGPKTVTIKAVSRGDADQPVNVTLIEFGDGRPFKPCKSMRRVMVAAWGPDASTYQGRRMTLYCDPSVRFGGQEVGGIRISHMSDIDQPLKVALTVTRGRRAPYIVDPLPALSDVITPDQHKRLYGLLVECGLGDKNAALTWVSEAVGKRVVEMKKLTSEQADRAINKATELLDAAGQPGGESTDAIQSSENTTTATEGK
ncbi:Uncharacterised protein [Mycobacteroides abscessus subsp. massiliense]|uniref:hypothetical protein n=1 Tax=Mycobacteroides abscessus TaxID=36809 RepID=UPI0009A6572F|nr:hypothetical protein [Mycobacteroides abscessus]SKL67512.1 Uncharacterised protein [Mycobacteroides abscessus subsp. massiliense]SKS24139.1 Uncharacterised protein [Mycobacteroides abscessus subsp. bolletii]SKS46655.1 Uncharacterised protein [Mycobacteroides abscessus subsp. bolletii]SKV02445.1 Uncharacterised protein [Mycobacteroides abscessus subsp. abscessus]SKZ09222.1 Uncharacterised protein [Mycobacteroides abscessus subsp. abscessus]